MAAVLIFTNIIAVQGLGSDPYYTWVRRIEAPKVHVLETRRRLRDSLRFSRSKKQSSAANEEGIVEIMWLRDLLVPDVPDARVATYSYRSDWRDPTVKTSLRQCAERFLNTLKQSRQHENVMISSCKSLYQQ